MGAYFSRGRVYSQIFTALVGWNRSWITQPVTQAPPLFKAGSHKTHRHGIEVGDFAFFVADHCWAGISTNERPTDARIGC